MLTALSITNSFEQLTPGYHSRCFTSRLACSRLRDGGGKSFSNKKCEKRTGAGERQGDGQATTAPFPKLCASYFRFAHFHTLPLYYLRAWHRLPLNYRGIVGANTNEVQETIILYTARIEVLIGGIVAKVMVVHSVCKAHKLISVGNSCKNFHLFILLF